MLNDIGKSCTACGACESVCPTKAISFVNDRIDCKYPIVNKTKCIDCNKCNSVCHIQNPPNKSSIICAYAGWSNDENCREKSASGGVATVLYSFCLQNGWIPFGATYLRGKGTVFIEIKTEEDIKKCQNSKYSFSDMRICFDRIKTLLNFGKMVLFIGLPCQVGALKTYLKKEYNNLYTVDIICHGIAPNEYLEQHIKYIEKKYKNSAENMSFRDWRFGTDNYYFTLSDNKGNIFYKKKVARNDAYQEGYHKSLIYRENCYECRYANSHRVSDVTLSDWNYYAAAGQVTFDKRKVNSIICSTEKGKKLIEKLAEMGEIYIVERTIDEPLNTQQTLKTPHKKHYARERFHNKYISTKDFDKSVNYALRKEFILNELKYILRVEKSKSVISKIIPPYMKQLIRRCRKKG